MLIISLTNTSVAGSKNIVLAHGDFKIRENECAIRILTNAYKEIGYKVVKKAYPTRRALMAANIGKIDGVFSHMEETAEWFPNLIRINVPICRLKLYAYSKKKINANTLDDLNNVKIGITKDSIISKQALKGKPHKQYVNNAKLYEMLLNDHVDIIILVGQGARRIINRKKYPIHELPFVVGRENYYHFLHKKNSPLVQQLTAILKRYEKEGFIERANNEDLNYSQ